jgi:hypothetical protein
VSDRTPKRKPSASPVCYADEKDVAPGYMWAEHPRKDDAKPKHARAKPRKAAGKKSGKR